MVEGAGKLWACEGDWWWGQKVLGLVGTGIPFLTVVSCNSCFAFASVSQVEKLYIAPEQEDLLPQFLSLSYMIYLCGFHHKICEANTNML